MQAMSARPPPSNEPSRGASSLPQPALLLGLPAVGPRQSAAGPGAVGVPVRPDPPAAAFGSEPSWGAAATAVRRRSAAGLREKPARAHESRRVRARALLRRSRADRSAEILDS